MNSLFPRPPAAACSSWPPPPRADAAGTVQAQAPEKVKVAAIYTVPVEQQWVSRIHRR